MYTWLFLAFLLTTVNYCQPDTKILRKIKILDNDSFREETLSLKNENTPQVELVIAGTYTQSIYPKDNQLFVYRLDTVYVADKDGYRVKYKLVREPNVQIVLQLNPSTLKSVTG